MPLLKYRPDLPQIPLEYLPTLETIRSGKNLFRIGGYQYYEIYELTDNRILDLLTPHFVPNAFFGYQIIREGIAIHKDGNRETAVNYLLDTGGEDSKVGFYAEDQQTSILQVHVPVHTWYQMDTVSYHGLSGLTRTRYAITVNPRRNLNND